VSDLLTDFMEGVYPSKWMRRLGKIPDPWQEEVLDSSSRFIALNCCRQAGKTDVVAFLAGHEAAYKPDSLILATAPAERQSKILFARTRAVVEKAGVTMTAASKTHMEFDNGSEIYALPGKDGTIRGYSPKLVIIDEASRAADELYYAVRPMMAMNDGRMVLLSTPWGKRGFYHEVWMGGAPEQTWHAPWKEGAPEDDWHRISVNAREHPRYPQEFVDSEQAVLPDWIFKQEYMCEFAETQDAVFAYNDIEAMFLDDVEGMPDAGDADVDFDNQVEAYEFD